ncbi:glycosyltransferase family 4 protein [uncultured Clostridium sp.]|uniref:glycosyltransferase family 4 protein n=1 Tax=uncultured Clostridium sp. TaxID=59620 RepID=UPI00262F9997|nr:glycosyltransferase family 4 protein [uncultured Clostridium sp.]
MKIAILTSGVAPVPATKGGAVENLVQHILEVNEKNKDFKIEVYSIYDSEAEIDCKRYKETKVKFFKPSFICSTGDKFIYFVMTNILKRKNNMKFRSILSRFEYIKKVKKELNKNEYDKVILENHPTIFMALKGDNEIKFKDKYYYHLHNEVFNMYGCEEIARNSKKIMGVSKFICENIQKMSGIAKDKVVPLYNCIDIEKFSKDMYINDFKDLRKTYGIQEDDIVAVYSGRLAKDKGIFETLQGIKNIDNPKVKLLIIGAYFYGSDMKSEYQTSLMELAEEIKDRVIFTGYVHYKDIPKVYSIADFAILPSLCNEAAGLTIIEAMAMRLPVITTNAGGIPEYIDESAGFILNRDEKLVDNITQKAKILVEDKELREKIGMRAEQEAKNYNLDNYYNSFKNILEE